MHMINGRNTFKIIFDMWYCKKYKYLTNSKTLITTINKKKWPGLDRNYANYLLLHNEIFSPVHSSFYNNPIKSKQAPHFDNL